MKERIDKLGQIKSKGGNRSSLRFFGVMSVNQVAHNQSSPMKPLGLTEVHEGCRNSVDDPANSLVTCRKQILPELAALAARPNQFD